MRYVDPDGREVFMAGLTVTTSCGTGFTGETGIAFSKDKNGYYQVGIYQISGAGFVGGMGASVTGSFSWAPFSEYIADVSGLTETIGGSFTFGALLGFSLGGDVNIPVGSSMKNLYFSMHLGVGTSGGEGHAMTTSMTTQLYGEGWSLAEAWENSIKNGMLENISPKILEHFQQAYTTKYSETLLITEQKP